MLNWKISNKIKDRFLGNGPVATFSTKALSVVAGILTIWIFAQQVRHKKLEKYSAEDEEWNSQLQEINYKLEQLTTMLTCYLEVVHANGRNIRKECIHLTNWVSSSAPLPLTKSSHLIKTKHIENNIYSKSSLWKS